MASISDELAFRRKQQRSSRTAIGAFEDQETKGSHTLYGDVD